MSGLFKKEVNHLSIDECNTLNAIQLEIFAGN